MRRTVQRIAVLAGVTAAALALATPALAEEGNAVMESGEYIAWRGNNFGSSRGFYDFATDKRSYAGIEFHFVTIGVDRNTSSVENRSSVNQVQVFLGQNYTGSSLRINPGARLRLNLAPYTAFDNAIRSHHF